MKESTRIPLWKILTETDTSLLVLIAALFAWAGLFAHPDLRWRTMVPVAVVWLFLGALSLVRARLNRERLRQMEDAISVEIPELRRNIEELHARIGQSQLQGARMAVELLCSDPFLHLSAEQKLQIREWSRQFEDEDPGCWN